MSGASTSESAVALIGINPIRFDDFAPNVSDGLLLQVDDPNIAYTQETIFAMVTEPNNYSDFALEKQDLAKWATEQEKEKKDTFLFQPEMGNEAEVWQVDQTRKLAELLTCPATIDMGSKKFPFACDGAKKYCKQFAGSETMTDFCKWAPSDKEFVSHFDDCGGIDNWIDVCATHNKPPSV